MEKRRSADAETPSSKGFLSNGRSAVESAVAGRCEFAGKRSDVEVVLLTAETADPEQPQSDL